MSQGHEKLVNCGVITYDVTKTDLAFKVTEIDSNGWLHLSIAKGGNSDEIGRVNEDSAATATRVDFFIYQGNNQFCVREVANGSTSYSQPVYEGTVICKDVAHTFGIRKVGEHWYPAIDGVVKTAKTSYRLDKFMETNGTALRFGIGANGPEFKAEDIGIINANTLWQAIPLQT